MALQHFDRLADRLAGDVAQGVDLQWLWEDNTLKALALVLGSSHFLWEDFLRLHYETLLPIFKDLRAAEQRLSKEDLTVRLQQALHGVTTGAAAKHALNAYKDQELFRIDMRHLLHRDLPFGAFADELAELAEVVLAGALEVAQDTLQARYGRPRLADGQPCRFALFGLGKLGGRELGYASDLEMLCVYRGQGQTTGPQQIAVSQYAELLVQHLLDLIVARRSGTFEIDLRLRPFGSKGPLATSLDAFRDYYRSGGQAAPFERQALIKLRWVAGDPTLGQIIETLRDAFVYSAAPFALATAVHLRQRQRHELVVPGAIDAKYSQGGLVDIEYLAQYLQLRHGATVPALRTPHTLAALQALSQAQIVSATAYQTLHDAYVFLRRLVDALRLASGQAHDLVIPATDTNAFIFLARRMGYWEEQGTPAHLAHLIAHHMQQAAQLYEAYCLSAGAPPTGS
jgi:glutamate-ammonia-ligase adenylyltransferase